MLTLCRKVLRIWSGKIRPADALRQGQGSDTLDSGACGGTGRRARLRTVSRKGWRFKSSQAHHSTSPFKSGTFWHIFIGTSSTVYLTLLRSEVRNRQCLCGFLQVLSQIAKADVRERI